MADLIMARPGTSLIGDFLWQSTPVSGGWLGCQRGSAAAAGAGPCRVAAGDLWFAGHAPVQPVCSSRGLGLGSVVAAEASAPRHRSLAIAPMSEPRSLPQFREDSRIERMSAQVPAAVGNGRTRPERASETEQFLPTRTLKFTVTWPAHGVSRF